MTTWTSPPKQYSGGPPKPLHLQQATRSPSPSDGGSPETIAQQAQCKRAAGLLGLSVEESRDAAALSAGFQLKLREIKWQKPEELKQAHKELLDAKRLLETQARSTTPSFKASARERRSSSSPTHEFLAAAAAVSSDESGGSTIGRGGSSVVAPPASVGGNGAGSGAGGGGVAMGRSDAAGVLHAANGSIRPQQHAGSSTTAAQQNEDWFDPTPAPFPLALCKAKDWDSRQVANWAKVVSPPAAASLMAQGVDGEALVAIPSYEVLHRLLVWNSERPLGGSPVGGLGSTAGYSMGRDSVGAGPATTQGANRRLSSSATGGLSTQLSQQKVEVGLRGASLKLW